MIVCERSQTNTAHHANQPAIYEQQRELLATHRRVLAQYLKQQALVGEAYASPVVQSGGFRFQVELIRRWFANN